MQHNSLINAAIKLSFVISKQWGVNKAQIPDNVTTHRVL